MNDETFKCIGCDRTSLLHASSQGNAHSELWLATPPRQFPFLNFLLIRCSLILVACKK